MTDNTHLPITIFNFTHVFIVVSHEEKGEVEGGGGGGALQGIEVAFSYSGQPAVAELVTSALLAPP